MNKIYLIVFLVLIAVVNNANSSYMSTLLPSCSFETLSVTYNWYGSPPYWDAAHTPEKTTIDAYYTAIVAQDYSGLSALFTDDVTYRLIGWWQEQGRNVVTAFHHFGDPATGNVYEVLDVGTPRYTQDRNIVHAEVNSTVLNLLTGTTSVIWSSNYFTFIDAYISEIRTFFDTLDTFVAYSAIAASNTTALCQRIQSYCAGALAQFASQSACVTFMNSKRTIDTDFVPRFVGNSVACRNLHAKILPADPTDICPMVGSLATSPCRDGN